MLLRLAIVYAFLSVAVSIKTDNNRESVYSYEGLLEIGTETPKHYFSFIRINADIHVLVQNNGDYWMRLKNVTYRTISGDEDYNEEDDYTKSIPDESKDITLPFIYHASSNRTSKGLTVDVDEGFWSRRMKQSIAELFYQDRKVERKISQTFRSDDGFDYVVLKDKNLLKIIKTMSTDLYESKVAEDKSIKRFPITIFKKRTYDMSFDENIYIKKIEAISNIEYNPLNGNSENFYLFTNQTLHFKEMQDTDMLEMNRDNMVYSEIYYDKNSYMDSDGFLNITSDRVGLNKDKLMTEVKTGIVNIYNNLHKSHIVLQKTRRKDNERLDLVLRKMKYLDEDRLRNLYSSFSEDADISKFALELISMVGTPSSSLFVVQLIQQGKIENEELALDYLQNLPTYAVKYPRELDTDLMNLINNTKSKEIQNQAILTLSNFMGKFKMSNNKAIKYFIKKLQLADDEKEQLLYVYALGNIKLPNSEEEMIHIAMRSEIYEKLSARVRAESLYGLTRTKKIDDFIWFIFSNRTEELEVRLAALNLLIDFDRTSNIERMFWMLKDEDEEDQLRHLFYTKLKMIAENEFAEFDDSRAKELLPQFNAPASSFLKSSSHFYKAFDNYGVGSAFEITYYSKSVIDINPVIRMKKITKLSGPMYNRNEIVMNFPSKSSGDLTYIINGQVISYRNKDMSSQYLSYIYSSKTKLFFISQDQDDEIFIPTDLGIPLVFRNNWGYMAKFDVQFQPKNEGNLILDIVYRDTEVYGFTSYDPISDTWMGIERVKTLDAKLPIDVDIKLNSSARNIVLTLEKSKESFGIQSFVYSEVFMKDATDGNNFKKSCAKCESPSLITIGEKNLENYVFLNHDCEHTGLHMKMSVFDCEQRVTHSYLSLIDLNSFWNLMSSPTPGMCGVGLKMEKSEKYPATQLRLTTSFNDTFDEDNTQTSKVTFSYNVMNGENIEKSWDLNALYSKNGENWKKMEFNSVSRKEGSPKHKVCLETVDKWKSDHFSSAWKLAIGDDESEDYCPKVGSLISMDVKAEQSKERKDLIDTEEYYTSCSYTDSKLSDCLKKITSYDFYTFDIKYDNLSDDLSMFWNRISDLVKFNNAREFVRMEKSKIPENQIKMFITSALDYDSYNVSILTKNEAYRYDDMETEDYYRYLLSRSFFMKYNMGMKNYCEVVNGQVTDNSDKFNDLKFVDGWADLAGLQASFMNLWWQIKVKKVDDSNDMILHIFHDNNTAEIQYKDDFVLIVNDKPKVIQSNQITLINNFGFLMLTDKDGKNQRMFVKLDDLDVVVDYTKDRIRMSLRRFTGQCHVSSSSSRFIKSSLLDILYESIEF